jgi:hypothetical protein
MGPRDNGMEAARKTQNKDLLFRVSKIFYLWLL